MPLPTLLAEGTLQFGNELAPRPGRAIDELLAWIRARLPELGRRGAALADRVLVVQAATGTGKSTVLPVELFRALRSGSTAPVTAATPTYTGRHILCCQPRVLTAVTLATDVSRARLIDGKMTRLNPDIVMGKTVGFQTRPLRSKQLGGLIYATVGILAAQLRSASDAEVMARYRVIIIDEAHERSLEADLTLLLLRDFYQRNLGDERLPFVVVASATFDPDRMAAFFGVGKPNIARITGRAFPTVEVWPDAGSLAADFAVAAVAAVRRIHEANPGDDPERADILVFASGAAETIALVEGLDALNLEYATAGAGAPAPVFPIAVDGPAVAAESPAVALVFAPPATLPAVDGRRPARRVVVATTVAETGLTIDTLKYVVDNGWLRAAESYPMWGIGGVVTRPAAHSRIVQRRGRVGRMFPGEFHPLYARDAFDALDAQQLPDVATKGIIDIFLMVLSAAERRAADRRATNADHRAGADHRADADADADAASGVSIEPDDLGLPEAPPVVAVAAAHAVAAAIGAVARAPLGWTLTPLGVRMAKLERVPMAAARIVLAGCAWRAAASDLLTVAAAVATGDPRVLTLDESRASTAGGRALLAALPPALGGPRPAVGASLTSEDHRALLRTRLALADDFAELVLVFDAFATRIGECRAAADYAAVETWCDGIGVSYDAMLDFAARRDEIAAECVAAGLDPCRDDARRLAIAGATTFGATLRAIKRCLYDGLRHNLMRAATRPGASPLYLTGSGIAVAWRPWASLRESARAVGGPASLPPPTLAIASGFILQAERGVLRYSVTAPLVSILDGFLAIDPAVDRAARAPAPVTLGGTPDDPPADYPLDVY